MPSLEIEAFHIGMNENVIHKETFGLVDSLLNEKPGGKCPILPHGGRVHPSRFAPIHTVG